MTTEVPIQNAEANSRALTRSLNEAAPANAQSPDAAPTSQDDPLAAVRDAVDVIQQAAQVIDSIVGDPDAAPDEPADDGGS